MNQKRRKSFYNFGILTVVMVFTLLCITAVCCVSMLNAYTEYTNTLHHGRELKEYYQNIE